MSVLTSRRRRARAGQAARLVATRRRRVLAATLFAPALEAAPLTLSGDADFAALADRVRDYAEASRVKWIVAAATQADADAAVAALARHLTPADRYLVARVKAQTLADAAPDLAGAGAPLAWIAPQIGAAPGAPACSWQVWVSDPAFPSPGDAPLAVPLAAERPPARRRRGDVPRRALRPAAIQALRLRRNAARRHPRPRHRPDADIPVAAEPEGETIFLAMARQTAPFLERLKSALAASEGQRRDLGKDFALRDKLLGEGRGIGANIQVIPPGMVAPKQEKTANGDARPRSEGAGALMETCLFALTPAQ